MQATFSRAAVASSEVFVGGESHDRPTLHLAWKLVRNFAKCIVKAVGPEGCELKRAALERRQLHRDSQHLIERNSFEQHRIKQHRIKQRNGAKPE